MNENCLVGWACPECGQEDEFLVEVKMVVALTDDGTDPYASSTKYHQGVDWEPESFVECADCGHQGRVMDFCPEDE